MEIMGGDKSKTVSGETIRSKAGSGLLWKFLEVFCADSVSFVVSIVLARLLLPSDYGEIALVNIFIVIANVFVVNGLGTALIQKKNADEVDYSSVLYFNFAFSLVLYMLLFLSAPTIAAFYNIPHLCDVLRVLGIRVPIAAINSVQNAILSRHLLFKRMFIATIIGTILSAVVGIAMAYKGFGVWALVTQVLTNAGIDTIVLSIIIRWWPKLHFSWSRLKGMIDYGWKILASSLIKTGYEQLSSLIIGKLYTAEDLAFYSKGKKYPDLIVSSINTSISSVLFPIISSRQDDISCVKNMLRRSIKTSSYILTPMLFGLAAVGEPLISLILTDKWLPCVPYMRLYCLYCAFLPIQTANLQAIRAVGRSDIILKLDIIKRGIGITLLLLLMRRGVMGVALAPLGMTLLATVINIIPNKNIIKYSFKEQMADWIPNIIVSLGMAVAVYALSLTLCRYISNRVIIILLAVLFGFGFYIAESILFKNESFYYVKMMVKAKFSKSNQSRG